jgi:hypothetical protein
MLNFGVPSAAEAAFLTCFHSARLEAVPLNKAFAPAVRNGCAAQRITCLTNAASFLAAFQALLINGVSLNFT